MSDEPQTGNDQTASSGCFLKGIAALGAIVTIASGAIKITEWWEQRSQLTADVSVSGFALPPHANETREKVEAAAKNADAIRAALDLPKTTSEIDQKLIAIKVASYLRTLLPQETTYSWRQRGIWSVEVKNNGSHNLFCCLADIAVGDCSPDQPTR